MHVAWCYMSYLPTCRAWVPTLRSTLRVPSQMFSMGTSLPAKASQTLPTRRLHRCSPMASEGNVRLGTSLPAKPSRSVAHLPRLASNAWWHLSRAFRDVFYELQKATLGSSLHQPGFKHSLAHFAASLAKGRML